MREVSDGNSPVQQSFLKVTSAKALSFPPPHAKWPTWRGQPSTRICHLSRAARDQEDPKVSNQVVIPTNRQSPV